MYANAKIIPVKTTPGVWGGGEGRRRMVEKVNSCMISLIYCNNLCKCHNIPPPITTIKKNNKFKIAILTKTDTKTRRTE
jgi:hypothetical protein